jgi:hypothetical protein
MKEKDEKRFWGKVTKAGEDECWEWTGHKSAGGYGRFYLGGKKPKPKTVAAHRFAYAVIFGPIPDGLIACHRCDNPSCVNPSHLFIGTHQDNSDDKLQKKRHPHGSSHPRAILSEQDVASIRRRRKGGESYESISSDYPAVKLVIRSAAVGNTWRHVEETPVLVGSPQLSDDDVVEIRRRRSLGATFKSMAEAYLVSTSTIKHACTGSTYKHVTAPPVIMGRVRRGIECYNAKLTERQVGEIKQKAMGGVRVKALANEYNTSMSKISNITAGRIWKHVQPLKRAA